jgi:conjugative transfer signal peptidase TraF
MIRGRWDNLPWMIRAGLFAAGALACLFGTFSFLGLRINLSPSLPVGIYVVDGKGGLVEFCPDEPFGSLAIGRGYRAFGSCLDSGAPLLKPVIATVGDIVEYSAAGIFVNGVQFRNTAPVAIDTIGRPLTHWPFGRYQVPAGSVWTASSYNSRSFDSRYFGPVPLIAIRNRVRPLICFRGF